MSNKLIFPPNHWSEFVICPPIYKEWAITLGNFDGLHLGHSFLIGKLKEKAFLAKVNSGIITFLPHPKKVLQKKEVYEVYDSSKKKELLLQQQVNSVFFLKFDAVLAQMSATDFVSALCAKIPIRYFYVGYDFSFGKNRQGNIDLLKTIAREKNFEVIQLPSLKKELVISSSYIRKLLLAGNFLQASNYLGSPWSLESKVLEGQQVGRKLGFPTLNLEFEFYPPLKKGVYIVEAIIQGKRYKGVANYGIAPSVQKIKKPRFECHLLDFQKNIYGVRVKIIPLKLLRPENQFASLRALKAQITLDIRAAKCYFQGRD